MSLSLTYAAKQILQGTIMVQSERKVSDSKLSNDARMWSESMWSIMLSSLKYISRRLMLMSATSSLNFDRELCIGRMVSSSSTWLAHHMQLYVASFWCGKTSLALDTSLAYSFGSKVTMISSV